jgi:hypothetical protein
MSYWDILRLLQSVIIRSIFKNWALYFARYVIDTWGLQFNWILSSYSWPLSGYCCTWSYSDTTHSIGLLWKNDDPSQRRLTAHNIHKRQTSMTLAGFEPTIAAGERPQTHVLDRATTGFDRFNFEIHIELPHNYLTNESANQATNQTTNQLSD